MAFNPNAQQPWSLKMVVPLEAGIVCIDIDRMLEFYTGVLGLKLVSDAKTTPEMSKRFGATPYGYRIVRLQTPYGERIKLVQPGAPPKGSPIPEWACERQGLAYLTFVIEDMKGVIKRLIEHGVRLLSEEPVEVRKGVFGLFCLDPEGNVVEFAEYPDISSYRPDLFKRQQLRR